MSDSVILHENDSLFHKYSLICVFLGSLEILEILSNLQRWSPPPHKLELHS